MKQILLFIFFYVVTVSCYAQTTYYIKGKVVDAQTHEAMAFVSIGVKDTPRGTITNEQGEFIVTAPTLPAALFVTHLGYQTIQLTVTDEQPVNIKLQQQATSLHEVVIGDQALAIMRRVAERAAHDVEKLHNTKVFFRQVSADGKKPFFFAESYMDMQWANYGFVDYYITNSRYLERSGGIPNRNISTVSLLSAGFTRNFLLSPVIFFPADHRAEMYYKFELKKKFKDNGRNIAEIKCNLRNGYDDFSAFEGSYYVDVDSYAVLKIDGNITNFRINGRPIETKLLTAYKIDKQGNNILNYSSFKSKAAYNTGGFFDKRITISTTIFALSYDEKIYENRLRKLQIKTYDTDQARFKLVPYDAGFWRTNAVIKRTPEEDTAVAEMEKSANGNMNAPAAQTDKATP